MLTMARWYTVCTLCSNDDNTCNTDVDKEWFDVILTPTLFYACKNMLYGRLVVTFAAIWLPVPRFKPRPGQKLGLRFLLQAQHEASPQEPKMVPVPVPSPDTKRAWLMVWGADNTTKKRIRRLKSIAMQSTPTVYNQWIYREIEIICHNTCK